VNQLLNRARESVKVLFQWEKCPFWTGGSLTGIPPHIKIFVNQQVMMDKMNERFDRHEALMINEMDKRAIGGHVSVDMMQERVTKPLEERLNAMNATLMELKSNHVLTNDIQGGSHQHSLNGFYLWKSDNGKIPHLLPDDFKLNASIPPLLIWHQWHLGQTIQGQRKLPALKCVTPKDYAHGRRIFMRMRLFCKSIDDICKPSQSDMSMPILTRIFNSKKNDLVVASVLLAAETSTGRKRTRDENGWNYIASIYEKMSTAKKKAERTGESLDSILARDQEQTRIRQANNRNRRKRLHSSNSTNDDVQDTLQNAPEARRLPASAVDLNLFNTSTRGSAARLFN
jgi:hypothetical protein